VSTEAGVDETLDPRGPGVDDPDPVEHHVGDQEPGAVGGEADVLGIAEAPGSRLLRAPPIAMASRALVAPGVGILLRLMTETTLVAWRSITSSLPLNSQLATKKDRSAE
jgi:hypothetical protein